ncbi:MAG TPA: hypothetical protein VM537_36595 [Anaerolineae bacterium]|nr:hypothetical protein [Anaerolineae bacterium]
MSRPLHGLCAGLLLALLLGSHRPGLAADAVPVWQTQFSDSGFDSDHRLECAVSISLPDSDLGTIFSHLSAFSGVALTCDDDLRSRPITLYLPLTRLKDAMAELASFTMCEWWEMDDPSGYRMRKTPTLRQAEEKTLARYSSCDFSPPEADPELVEAVARRLREYEESLSVPQDQLVEEYEDSDPWLAASQLNPLYRGLIPFLTSLSHEDIRLMAVGRLSLRIADLPTGVLNHLERAALGDFDNNLDYGPRLYHPRPDTFTLYSNWEERWDHATIDISWLPEAESGDVCIRFNVPDTHASTPVMPIRAKDGARSIALDQIFRRTHRIATPEQIKEKIARIAPISEAENERGGREKASRTNNERLSLLRKLGADWSDKAVLERRVIPWPDASRTASLGEVLVSIAEQADMPLVADYVVDYLGGTVPPELWKEQTVREALERASRRWGSDTVWSKPLGRYARVNSGNSGAVILSLASPSPEFLRKCEEAAQGKQSATLEDFLSLVGDMGPGQAYLGFIPTRWQYASRKFTPLLIYVDAPNLRRMLAGDEIRFVELAESQRRLIATYVGSGRSRLTEADLVRATLKLLRTPRGSMHGPLVLLCEYHLSADAIARQVLLECPLSVPFDPPAPVNERILEPEPAPLGPPTDATLIQTNWLYWGYVTYGENRAAMLTNDSTGEMEIAEEGQSFRGLVVSSATDTFAALCDSAGDSYTLALRPRASSEPDLSDLPL